MNHPSLARIKWQCRRGMLELDLLLEQIVEHQLPDFNERDLNRFSELLSHQDPELFAWLMGHAIPEDENHAAFIRRLRQGMGH